MNIRKVVKHKNPAEKPKEILPATFYKTAADTEPVREWLKEFDREDRRTIGTDIRTVEYGWPVGMPVCKSLKKGLYEVRSTISGPREARVFFCIHKGQMVLLHAFIKKTQKTPKRELKLARDRKWEIEQ